jgi:ornithine cyclodeaminase
VTGVTARRLARPGARVAAILGAGVQAADAALGPRGRPARARRGARLGHRAERAEAFRERSDAVVPVASAEEACRDADVIVAATMAPEPYVPPEWLGVGSLFCSVSSLDAEIACVERADLVVCDLWEHETGHHSRPLARALAAGAVSRGTRSNCPIW